MAGFTSVSELKEEGNRLFKSGEFRLAIDRYNEALDSTDCTSNVKEVLYNNISQCWLCLEKWNEAVQTASRVLEMDPANEKALYRRAVGYEGSGKLTEALRDTEMLIARENKNGIVLMNRLRAKMSDERAHVIDEILPHQIVSVLAATLERLHFQKYLSIDDMPWISPDEVQKIVSGVDSLRSWVVHHERRRMVLKCDAIPKLIDFLKLKCLYPSSTHSRTEKPVANSSVNENEKFEPTSLASSSTPSADQQVEDFNNNYNEVCSDASTTVENHYPIEDPHFLPIVRNHDMLNIHLAIWRLLVVLITDSKFNEDQQEQQQRRTRQLHSFEKPLQFDPFVVEARDIFQSYFGFDEIYELFKTYVRAGLGALDEPSNEIGKDVANDGAIRSRCAVLITEALRSIGTLDGGSCLEVLGLGISSIECRGVVRASLQALGGLADARRRYGTKVKALKKSQALMKSLENVLQLLSSNDQQINDDAEFALTLVFALLADRERAPEDEICIQDLGFVLLGPYFVEGRDAVDSYVGLKALLLLWTADRESVKTIISTNNYISILVHYTSNVNPACPELQRVAAEVLMHAMEFSELRTEFLDIDGVTELANLCRCQLRYDKDTDLRIKIAATLARLCMHSEDIRKQVFDEFDFFQMASNSLRQFRVSKPDSSKSNSRTIKNKFKQTLRNFLEVMFFLTLHGAFKSELLNIIENDLNNGSTSTIASTISDIGECLVMEKDGLGGYYFSNVFCNLLRSRETKERRKRRNNQSGPQLDDEQLDALEEFFDKLPEHSRPSKNSKFDRGGAEIVTAIADAFMKQNIVKKLSQLCLMKNSTLNEVSAASEAIGLFAHDSERRGLVVQQGAVAALLSSANALATGGALYQEDLSRCRQSLCHICISINPNLFTYREMLDIVPHLLALLDDTYELYQYEAALALTNITSTSEEARQRVFHGQGWRSLMNLVSGDNDMCRAAGLEGLCNMAMSDLVQDRFAEGFNSVDLQLLLAFLGESNNPRAQSAAAGCLAILTSDARVALRLCCISNVSNIVRLIKDKDEMREKSAILIRIATIASNIAQAVKMDQPIFVKEQKLKDEEPITISITDEMKSVSQIICKAFKDVDRSTYSPEILRLVRPLVGF